MTPADYERRLRSCNRWINALFLILADAGIRPSSTDIVNALKRIDQRNHKDHAKQRDPL